MTLMPKWCLLALVVAIGGACTLSAVPVDVPMTSVRDAAAGSNGWWTLQPSGPTRL